MIHEHFFDDLDSMLAALAVESKRALADAREKPALAYLSGGSTPKPLYEAMAQSDIDFDSVQFAMVDERWVDPTHPASNEQFIKQCFAGVKGFQFTGMKTPATDLFLAVDEVEQKYAHLPKQAALTILGMGDDGHTASFFPQAQGLGAALDLLSANRVAWVEAEPSAVTGDHIERMTLTLNTILSSDYLVLLIRGAKKREVYEAAKSASDTFVTPVCSVLQQRKTDVHVFWAP